MQNGNKMAISAHLSRFKERGIIAFDKILSIQSSERIPALVKNPDGRYEVLIALTATLKSAFNNINLRMGLNEDQIIELSDSIIDQSFEDNLSLEDVLLFLQKLLMGEAGKIYDRMDIPTFFEMFEKYRQERYEALLNIREEQQAQYKSFGPSERWSDMNKEDERDAFHEAMKDYLKNSNNGSSDQGS